MSTVIDHTDVYTVNIERLTEQGAVFAMKNDDELWRDVKRLQRDVVVEVES
jgi:hypothetical protein